MIYCPSVLTHFRSLSLSVFSLSSDSAGHIRISDFGLAVQLEEKYHYVMKGNAGTAGYLAEVWCLPHGTRLAMPNGETKAIEEVKVGQQLVGQDGRIVRVRERRDRLEEEGLYAITHEGESTHSVTAEHTFQTSIAACERAMRFYAIGVSVGSCSVAEFVADIERKRQLQQPQGQLTKQAP
jgi:hypothetical protein